MPLLMLQGNYLKEKRKHSYSFSKPPYFLRHTEIIKEVYPQCSIIIYIIL